MVRMAGGKATYLMADAVKELRLGESRWAWSRPTTVELPNEAAVRESAARATRP